MRDNPIKEVEDFLIDPTFQQYCGKENELSMRYWQRYIQAHPEQSETIAQAKELYHILTANRKPIPQQLEQLKSKLANQAIPQLNVRKFPWATWAAVAALFILTLGVSYWFLQSQDTATQQEAASHSLQVVETKKGEKKRFALSDGTWVTLNAASQLTIQEDFNKATRKVKLIGEAYFEVAKNKEKPFQLETADFDIHVLGTVFNVKSYPGEKESEAYLLEGLIEMHSKGKNNNAILIKPNQRVSVLRTILEDAPALQKSNLQQMPKLAAQEIVIQDIRPHAVAAEIPDIAWKHGRLVMDEQPFEEVIAMLERWYDVDISLDDPQLLDYRFTATFHKENIQQALEALQKVQPFKFNSYGKKITISKQQH